MFESLYDLKRVFDGSKKCLTFFIYLLWCRIVIRVELKLNEFALVKHFQLVSPS